MTRIRIPLTTAILSVCLVAAAFAPATFAATKLNGSGASFPFPIYSKWFKDFSKATKGVRVDYQSKGSGAGIQDFLNQVVDFAGSDAAMSDEDITVVVRSDSSGTTYVFTGHLSMINDEFKDSVGQAKSPQWPKSDRFVKAPKNDGITATVKQTPGSIGYIEYGYAKLTGADAYPIATFTWMIFPEEQDDKKAEAARELVEYCLTEGQKIADEMGYIPLPEGVIETAREVSQNIQ